MAEAVQNTNLKPFTTIKYTTKDGEHISATKNNGIVTLVGDKNGVRQMSMEDFKKELISNVANIQLEKTPEKDTVELTNKKADDKKTEEIKPEAKPAETKPSETKTPEAGKKLDTAA